MDASGMDAVNGYRMAARTAVGITIDPEFRELIPLLSSDQSSLFASGRLGFRGERLDGRILELGEINPSWIGPPFWFWSHVSSATMVEEFSPNPTAESRIPWNRFRGMTFKPVEMDPLQSYPPPNSGRATKEALRTVYFIEAVGSGFIKIGITNGSAELRLKELQTGSPHELIVRHTMPGTIGDERELHQRFDAHKFRGEWFLMCDEITAFMEATR